MNTELRLLLEALPHESRPAVERLWNQLPPDLRREAELTLGSFLKLARKNPSSVTDLLKLLQRNASPMLEEANQVAILGPVNVGKSTLYNALIHNQKDKAECSPVPGTTRTNQASHTGLFELLDTPGLDHGAESGGEERNQALLAAEGAEFLLVVFDAAKSVNASDRALYRRIRELGKPHLVVLNKMDLIPKSQHRPVRESAARILDLAFEQVIPISAQSAQGVENLILEITAAEPRLLVKVAESLPGLRRQLGWQAIRRAAVLSALVGLSPLPFVDLIPLTLIQGNLVLTLGRIYGRPLTLKSVFEMASTFGLGWLARLLFQNVSKLGGIPGWVLSASIAASTTMTIGFTALTWFETGKTPSEDEMKKRAGGLQTRVKEALMRLGRRKPSKKRVTQELENLLPEIFPYEESAPPAPPEPTPESSPPPDRPEAPPPAETN